VEWTKSALRTITDGYVVGEYYVRLSQGMLYKKIGDDWYYAEDGINPFKVQDDPLAMLLVLANGIERDKEDG
jgi:hypothetical protein